MYDTLNKIFLIMFCLLLVSCGPFYKDAMNNKTIEQLEIIVVNPDEPKFQEAVIELGSRGEVAAPILAKALMTQRRDSYIAGIELINMGEDAAGAIPNLIKATMDDREIVRAYSIFVFGMLGEKAKCTIPFISEHLWDPDPGVRAVSAGAVERITGENLVEKFYELDGNNPNSWLLDTPEGSIVSDARDWWIDEGQYIDWRVNGGWCDN